MGRGFEAPLVRVVGFSDLAEVRGSSIHSSEL